MSEFLLEGYCDLCGGKKPVVQYKNIIDNYWSISVCEECAKEILELINVSINKLQYRY